MTVALLVVLKITVTIIPGTGGSTPDTYNVTLSPGGGGCTITPPTLSCTITGLTDDAVDIEIAPGVVTNWTKLAIRDRIQPDLPAPAAPATDLTENDADRLTRD